MLFEIDKFSGSLPVSAFVVSGAVEAADVASFCSTIMSPPERPRLPAFHRRLPHPP